METVRTRYSRSGTWISAGSLSIALVTCALYFSLLTLATGLIALFVGFVCGMPASRKVRRLILGEMALPRGWKALASWWPIALLAIALGAMWMVVQAPTHDKIAAVVAGGCSCLAGLWAMLTIAVIRIERQTGRKAYWGMKGPYLSEE